MFLFISKIASWLIFVEEMIVDLKDLPEKCRPTYLEALLAKEPPIQSLTLGSKQNTESTKDKVHIPRELIGNWAGSDVDPFPGFDELEEYFHRHLAHYRTLQGRVKSDEICRVISTPSWPISSEGALEINLKTHFDIVNLALEVVRKAGRHLMIACGKSAKGGNTEANITSEPDRATFIAPIQVDENSDNLVYCFNKLDDEGAKKVRNILPGEIKLWYKFRREFLEAVYDDGSPDTVVRKQAEMVFTQIYQYLNERNAAIGYIMTDKELLAVRRVPKERYGMKYGVLDVSPSIPLSAEDGQMNAKYVLFYLHYRYGIMEPHLSEMKKTVKPNNWASFVYQAQRARKDKSQAKSLRSNPQAVNLDDMRETIYDD